MSPHLLLSLQAKKYKTVEQYDFNLHFAKVTHQHGIVFSNLYFFSYSVNNCDDI